MDESDYVDLITEIFRGYTELSYMGGSVFLRHITIFDQQKIHQLIGREKKRCIERGIETEEEKLLWIKEEGHWTDDDDLHISEMESYVTNLYQTKKKVLLPSQKKEIQKTIDEEEAKLNELKFKRRELIGQTAEDFAARRSNEEFLRHLLYKDENCKELCFSADEFGEISHEDLNLLYGLYQETMQRFNDDAIQDVVLQDSFGMYLGFVEKPFDFFGRAIVDFTLFQTKILVYGRTFLSIFQNIEGIPDNIRKNPKALLDFADSSRNRDKKKSSAKGKEGSTGFVVGSKEDVEFYEPGATVGDLSAELKKNGGMLSQNDLLKQMKLI